MEIKKINTHSSLIEKRNKQLNELNDSFLKAYGKLLGMDMFLWLNPDLNELHNTLNSFPSPIIWFGNMKDINALTQNVTEWNDKIHFICSYDEAGLINSNTVLDKISNLLTCKSIDDAIKLIPSLMKKQACFIFTISGENQEFYKEKIANYIKNLKNS